MKKLVKKQGGYRRLPLNGLTAQYNSATTEQLKTLLIAYQKRINLLQTRIKAREKLCVE